ncbi:MAG: histidine phosphotransferase family protein [Magnetospiraceae bacterium]
MSYPVDLKIAELLCSRLCHDLVSPLGAVNAGLEAMEEDSGIDPQEARMLAAREAAVLTERLTLYRFAFGLGGDGAVPLPNTEVHAHCLAIAKGKKAELAWRAEYPSQWRRDAARLLVNMVILSVEALPRGGLITVDSAALDGGLGLAVSADGPRAGFRNAMRLALSPDLPVDLVDARNVQAYFTSLCADRLGAALEFSEDEGQTVALACMIP